MDYKNTLNMPKSGFPMRAGLPKREPEMLKHWEEMDLYNLMLKKNEGKPRFALHDGPPFSNGGLHMGHALNKSLKDFITRSYAMRGYYTPYIPGWDNHGMPIESAIIKQNKLNHKAMPVSEFRSACHEFAQHYIDVQMEGFKRIGVLGDWEHPYKTMDPGFEAEEVKVFGEMYKKGYIYKGLKPVYWCYHDETALAEAEIEYQDDPCTTVYVKFPMNDDLGKLSHLDKSKLNFVIWTTTIWTLPGNLAIALHPDEQYAIVKAPNGEMYIMAEALTDKVMKIGGFDSYEIVKSLRGKVRQCVVSNGTVVAQTKKLTRSGLGALMDGVFLSEQLGAEKPKKEFFDQVFAAIGPVEKSETMIVGDSLTSDIRGGDNAGIVTCWYNPEGIKAPEGYRIDHEIRDLHEVYGLL